MGSTSAKVLIFPVPARLRWWQVLLRRLRYGKRRHARPPTGGPRISRVA
jgi:hypothetical protein